MTFLSHVGSTQPLIEYIVSLEWSKKVAPTAIRRDQAVANIYFLYISLAFLLPIVLYLESKRRNSFIEPTIYELTHRMYPIDRELLREIPQDLLEAIPRPNASDYRRLLRVSLEDVKDQFHRIKFNASQVNKCAYKDMHSITKHHLELPGAIDAIQSVLLTERELRKSLRWVLFRIWVWNVSGFHKRQWGPIPDINTFRIAQVVEAYEQVKLAAVNFARCCGEAVVAEELSEYM